MKVAIYPGSFNPWHAGHNEVLIKALQVFDHVIVAFGRNPDKNDKPLKYLKYHLKGIQGGLPEELRDKISVTEFSGLLSETVKSHRPNGNNISAVIRGLRNIADFENEKTQQYWYEDTGLTVPIVYFISGREKCHISSSAIRQLEKFK